MSVEEPTIIPSPAKAGEIAKEVQTGREKVKGLGLALVEAFKVKMDKVGLGAEREGRQGVDKKVGSLAEVVVGAMAKSCDVDAWAERTLEGFDRRIVDQAKLMTGAANEKLLGVWGERTDKRLQAEGTYQMGWDKVGAYGLSLIGEVRRAAELKVAEGKKVAGEFLVERFGKAAGKHSAKAEKFEDGAKKLREWTESQKGGKVPEGSVVAMRALNDKLTRQEDKMTALEAQIDRLTKQLTEAGTGVGGPALGRALSESVPQVK